MKKNLTLVFTLLLAVCLKAQTVVNISGATTATWTAPSSGGPFYIRITARGGDGGPSKNRNSQDNGQVIYAGGQGAIMSGVFTVQNRETILAISGSRGNDFTEHAISGGGGGAGSGAVNATNGSILIIAGGGNGGNQTVSPALITAGNGDGGLSD